MIYFACPFCQTKLAAPSECMGKRSICGKCKQEVTVPPPPIAILVPAPTPSQGTNPTAGVDGHATTSLAKEEKATVPPRRYPRQLLLFMCLGGALMMVACGGLAWWFWGGKTSPQAKGKLWERHGLEARLSQATAAEVRQLLGDPVESSNQEARKNPHIQQLRAQALRMGMRPEEDPLSELWDREDLVTDIWLYRHVTRNPETGQADPELVIFLEQGRVRSLAIVGGLSGGTELVIFLEQGRVRQILYPPSASTTR